MFTQVVPFHRFNVAGTQLEPFQRCNVTGTHNEPSHLFRLPRAGNADGKNSFCRIIKESNKSELPVIPEGKSLWGS